MCLLKQHLSDYQGLSQKWHKEGVLRLKEGFFRPKEGALRVQMHRGYSLNRHFVTILVKMTINFGPRAPD